MAYRPTGLLSKSFQKHDRKAMITLSVELNRITYKIVLGILLRSFLSSV